MKIIELEKILKLSWTKETSYSPEEWTDSNPTLGQCDITALIIQDFMGGVIKRCMCGNISHYYNFVNNEIIDLTVEQIYAIIPDYLNSENRTREYILFNKNTKRRYLVLLKKVKENFMKYGEKEYKLRDGNNKEYITKIPGTVGGNKKLKIYGKIDCPSALKYIEKGYYVNNRVFFDNIDTAKKAGYRPCAKCMKKEYIEWKETNK